jgi:hypothetical protein
MFVPAFRRNALLPSSGWLNLVEMDAEVVWNRKWVDYVRRWQGWWPVRTNARSYGAT